MTEFRVINRDTERDRRFDILIEIDDDIVHEDSYFVPARETYDWPTRHVKFPFPREPQDVTVHVTVDSEEIHANFVKRGYDGKCITAFSVFSVIGGSEVLTVYEREVDC